MRPNKNLARPSTKIRVDQPTPLELDKARQLFKKYLRLPEHDQHKFENMLEDLSVKKRRRLFEEMREKRLKS